MVFVKKWPSYLLLTDLLAHLGLGADVGLEEEVANSARHGEHPHGPPG